MAQNEKLETTVGYRIVREYLEMLRGHPGFPERKYPPEFYADELAEKINAALPSQEGLTALKDRIDLRLNNHLCEMKPDYDDSITGFNEAWDIVRKTIAEALAK